MMPDLACTLKVLISLSIFEDPKMRKEIGGRPPPERQVHDYGKDLWKPIENPMVRVGY